MESAVNKAQRAGTKIHNKEERVEAYTDRLERLTENERGFKKLKAMVLDRFAIDTRDEDVLNKLAEGLYESEKRIAIEQGRGQAVERLKSMPDIVQRYKPLVFEKAEIQRKTLSAWLDYLQKNDAKHPMWFRYFVVRSLEKMGMLDKERAAYSKRAAKTVAPFPELNSEALGWVYKRLTDGIDPEDFQMEVKKKNRLESLIHAKDFAGLYAFAQIETAGKLNRESIEGAWKKYNKGSDYRLLEKDLKGKGTGWCTAEGSAKNQLQTGDFLVYYSKGSDGAYTEPRVAIRMEDENVAEVRGVNPKQELEPELVDIAQKKYHNLPGGQPYDKKASDMKRVTAIDKKVKANQDLSANDLRFLYEFDGKIEQFGYDPDPRVDAILGTRNRREDLCSIFNCTQEELDKKEHTMLKHIPLWEKIPAEATFKKDFKFDWIWSDEYKKGRPLSDFYFLSSDAEKISLEKSFTQSLTKSLDIAKGKESRPDVKVFEIGDVIRKKKKENPNHPGYLTTKEVLEAIDEAGYRPATFAELLAFGRDSWKPEVDPKNLTEEERVLQNVQAPYIYALGSPFSSARGDRCVPRLSWDDGRRKLDAFSFGSGWSGSLRFLVLRKASS